MPHELLNETVTLLDSAASPARVLVADDHHHVLEALRLPLKTHRMAVHAVSSPAAVLAVLRERPHEPYDLLLMDLNYARDTTSGEEGVELVARVRALDPDLPIVVMTAWSSVPLAVTTGLPAIPSPTTPPSWSSTRPVRRARKRKPARRGLTALGDAA